MKVEYLVLMGSVINPNGQITDTITWDDPARPTYETGRARTLVEAWVDIYGAEHARDILAGGWSNGYIRTKAV